MEIVPSKKMMIAICHYGGWFETNEDDGSMSYGGGEAYAVDVDNNMQLIDFMQEVAETLDSSVEGMLVKYFVPGNKQALIIVSNDEDFNRMVNHYKECDQFEVFIMEESSPAKTRPQSETQVASILPPAERDSPKLNEVIDIVTTDEITPIPDPSTTNNELHQGAKQWENIITGVGQRFNSIADFREALRKYSIAHGFNYVYKKNESKRVTAECKSDNCQWRIHASKLATTQIMSIRTMRPTHSCQGGSVKTATGIFAGNLIMEMVKDSPKIKPKDIVDKLKREYGVELNYSKASRAKQYARKQVLGSYKDAFSELPFFCEKLMEVNPGSVARFSTNEGFRLFFAFKASVSGFIQGCRPLLFLHGTPLNSGYQGMLLTATSADGDDKAFPVAFAVVDEENDDNWRWFLTEFKSMVLGHGPITFVADSQKGLRETLPETFGREYCYHAYCLYYLTEKLYKDLEVHFSDGAIRFIIEDYLYAAAYAPKLEGFEKYTQDIKAISPEAYNWIIRSELDHWANAFFSGSRYKHLTSNFGQPFYSWVSEANKLSITQVVDDLTRKMMQLIYTRRAESSQWLTPLTPSMDERLKEEILKAQSGQVLLAQGSRFEVRVGESVEIVDMESSDCSCKGWWLTGLPCCHAVAVLETYGSSPYDYCSRYFNADMYHLVYADSINPIPNLERLAHVELDDATLLVAQPTVSTPGRTKIRKCALGWVAPADFAKRKLECSKCKGLGHNKRSCKEVPEGGDKVLGNDDDDDDCLVDGSFAEFLENFVGR